MAKRPWRVEWRSKLGYIDKPASLPWRYVRSFVKRASAEAFANERASRLWSIEYRVRKVQP